MDMERILTGIDKGTSHEAEVTSNYELGDSVLAEMQSWILEAIPITNRGMLEQLTGEQGPTALSKLLEIVITNPSIAEGLKTDTDMQKRYAGLVALCDKIESTMLPIPDYAQFTPPLKDVGGQTARRRNGGAIKGTYRVKADYDGRRWGTPHPAVSSPAPAKAPRFSIR